MGLACALIAPTHWCVVLPPVGCELERNDRAKRMIAIVACSQKDEEGKENAYGARCQFAVGSPEVESGGVR